ncbi:MAG: hypothetical protein U0U67_16070 [Chitinophagales bacterium]
MKNLLIITVLTVILFASCTSVKIVSSPNLKAKSMKLEGNKRVSYFIYDERENRTYTLSEPPPDAILEKSLNALGKVDVEGQVTAEMKLDLASKVIQLGERTVAVNILRDALFRLSEMNINNRNQPLELGYRSLFDSILIASKTVAISDIIKAEADKAKAETKKLEAETQKAEAEIQLKKLDFDAGAYANYQTAVQFLLDKDYENALSYLQQLYSKYPEHFNIDEILSRLKELSKNKTISNEDWIKIYEFILDKHYWKIRPDLVENLKQSVNKYRADKK